MGGLGLYREEWAVLVTRRICGCLTSWTRDARLGAVNAASVAPEQVQDVRAAECVPRHDPGLLLIGAFKLSKAVFFVGVALGAMHFIHHNLSETVSHVFNVLRFDNENRFVTLVMGKAELVTHHRIRQFSIGTALYGILCSIEGTGLLLRKVWAEYLTLWLSVSFVPWEAYELIRHANVWRFVILLMNLLITAYLVWLLQRKRRQTASV